MLVFLHPRVLSRVAGFPVASPCLWGKLENLSFSNVSKQVVMSFCLAGVALCHIPTCLMMFTNFILEEVSYEMLVFCIHMSYLESLVFLWRRRVYGGSWKTCPIQMCPSRLSCRFAWQAWHFVTFQPVDNVWKISKLEEVSHEMLVFCTHVSRLEPLVFLWRRHVYGGSSALHTLHFTLHTPHTL